MWYGKQRRTQTRSEKTEEEGAQAGTEPPGDHLRQQALDPLVAATAGYRALRRRVISWSRSMPRPLSRGRDDSPSTAQFIGTILFKIAGLKAAATTTLNRGLRLCSGRL
jgi:hypothetical protein